MKRKQTKNALIVFCIAVTVLSVSQCKVKEIRELVVNAISPSWMLAVSSGALTVKGSGFSSDTYVVVNSTALETVFLNTTELRCTLDETVTSLALDVENGFFGVYAKEQGPDGDLLSNRIQLEIRHIPKGGVPVLLQGGAGFKYRGGMNLITVDLPTLYLSWEDREGYYSEALFKLMVSVDGGDTWSDVKDIPCNGLFVKEGALYGRISGDLSYRFYKSGDMGDSWEMTGETPTPSLSPDQVPLGVQLARSGGHNYRFIYHATTEDSQVTVFTYGSTDLGATWALISENTFDYSYIYQYGGVSPWGAFMNDSGAVSLDYGYNYGRHLVGTGLISRDGGVTYEEGGGAYSVDGGIICLNNRNQFYGLRDTYYTGFLMGQHFFVDSDLGAGERYHHDFWELIPEYDGDGYDMDEDTEEHLYLNRGNRMVRSYDFGKTWTVPVVFQEEFPEESRLYFEIDSQRTFYTLILTNFRDLYFARSEIQ